MSEPEDSHKSDLEKEEEEVRNQVDLKLIMDQKYLTCKVSYNLKIKVINVGVFIRAAAGSPDIHFIC